MEYILNLFIFKGAYIFQKVLPITT
jgi:hypothetical protein